MGRLRLSILLFLGMLALLSCGRVITRPTPIPPTFTPTPTLSPTPTSPKATPTPRPYTPPPTPTPTATPTPLIYTIQKGDTLLGIARRFGVSLQALQDLNGIVDPRRLQIGQPLIIPVGEAIPGTPTPTPTPIPLSIQGLYIYRSTLGDVWLLGEVINDSGMDVEQVVVNGVLLDDKGRVLTTTDSPSALDFVPSEERAPFALRFREAPTEFSSYQVEVARALPGFVGGYYLDLRVEDVKGTEEGYHAFFLDGTIRNYGSQDAVGVNVVATLYDAKGRVVGIRKGTPVHNVVPAGGTTTFHLEVQLFGGPVDDWRIVVSGHRPITPTP